MTYCPSCGSSDALILITSILCVKPGCDKYDKEWAEEQLTYELEEAYKLRDVSKVRKKLKNTQQPW